jgi:hypothetical protein
MKWEYFGTGLAFLGIGITMVLALPPPWWPGMPRVLVRGGLFIGLALIVYGSALIVMGIWPEYFRPKLIPLMVMSAGISVFVAGAIWFAEIANKDAPRKSTLDGILKFECSRDQFHLPSDGNLLEIVVNDNVARNINFQKHWLSEYAYKANPNIIPTQYGMIDKCRITNFGTAPVFNLKVSVEAVFSEIIPINEIMRQQKEVDRKPLIFYVDQVDAGANAGADIYVWNNTKLLVTLMFANSVELQRLGSTEREPVALIPAQRMIALFPEKT